MTAGGDHPSGTALRLLGSLALLALLGLGIAYLALKLAWLGDLSVAAVEARVRALGAWGVLVSIGLMVAHSFLPFPAEVVALANGMLYGPLWGSAVTWTGAMLGALVAFGLTRLLGRPFVALMLPATQRQRLDEWTRHYGAGLIFVARLVPVIAFNLINYAAGLTRVSWWAFIWSTGLGILPLTILMAVLGDRIETIGWPLWLALLAAGIVTWLLARRWWRRHR
ncbi:MAG TPA: TVP38/TMEM64 family protein [Alphaproteobacteria bacterium]|nr:TVP38/TMEM64 family protein [Alphaproteobacteria bacterium]